MLRSAVVVIAVCKSCLVVTIYDLEREEFGAPDVYKASGPYTVVAFPIVYTRSEIL